jgi:hypothetical protein
VKYFAALFALAATGSWTIHRLPFLLANGETARKYLPSTTPGGIAVFDYDGDGKLDLYFPNGGALPNGKKAPNRLLRNLGGMKFEDVTARTGVGGKDFDIGAAVGDFDNDGRLDIVPTALNAEARILRNPCDTGRSWLKVDVRRPGARVRVGNQWRQMTTAVGYGSSYAGPLHFGLGSGVLQKCWATRPRRVGKCESWWGNSAGSGSEPQL